MAMVLIYLRLMHNDFVWLYYMFFRCHRNVMEFVCIDAAVAFSPFLDEGKKQRLVAASCVFPINAMVSSPPSFLICVLLQLHFPSLTLSQMEHFMCTYGLTMAAACACPLSPRDRRVSHSSF